MSQRPTPVVLLHAAGMTPQMWQDQVVAIMGADAERQVLAPWVDGLRPGRPGELSLVGAAAALLSSLDVHGIERAFVVGHQLGAMVALQAAVNEPDRVAGLVLSGAAPAPGRAALAMQKTLIRMLPNRALADSGASKADLIKALDVIASADLGSGLARVQAPVLVVAGASDPLLPAAQQLAQRLPNARLAEIPGAAGNPSLEQAELYNQLLLDFLA